MSLLLKGKPCPAHWLPTRPCQGLPQPCPTLVLAKLERIHQKLGSPPAPEWDAISVPVTWVGSVLLWEITRVLSEGQHLSSPQRSTRTAGQARPCAARIRSWVFSLCILRVTTQSALSRLEERNGGALGLEGLGCSWQAAYLLISQHRGQTPPPFLYLSPPGAAVGDHGGNVRPHHIP